MNNRNITLSLPKDLLVRAKVLAARRETSISRLIASLLEDFVRREDDYEDVWGAEKELLERGLDMRVGKITWTRDESHQR